MPIRAWAGVRIASLLILSSPPRSKRSTMISSLSIAPSDSEHFGRTSPTCLGGRRVLDVLGGRGKNSLAWSIFFVVLVAFLEIFLLFFDAFFVVLFHFSLAVVFYLLVVYCMVYIAVIIYLAFLFARINFQDESQIEIEGRSDSSKLARTWKKAGWGKLRQIAHGQALAVRRINFYNCDFSPFFFW